MLVTITNTSGRILNAADVHDGGSGAVGGERKDPLPYPFGHIGSLAIAGTRQLSMRGKDWRYKSVPWLAMEPSEEWNILVQRGDVTMAFAAEATVRDQEELSKNTL